MEVKFINRGSIIVIELKERLLQKCPMLARGAAYFPKLSEAVWDIEIEAEIAASGDVPAYRYERLQLSAA